MSFVRNLTTTFPGYSNVTNLIIATLTDVIPKIQQKHWKLPSTFYEKSTKLYEIRNNNVKYFRQEIEYYCKY